MARISGIFPYSEDEVPSPVTDATLVSVPSGRDFTIDGPQLPRSIPKNRGAIIPSRIGNTDYIDCYTWFHTVFTGSF
jgi:hypothetical protein